jgi:hypothetical protein
MQQSSRARKVVHRSHRFLCSGYIITSYFSGYKIRRFSKKGFVDYNDIILSLIIIFYDDKQLACIANGHAMDDLEHKASVHTINASCKTTHITRLLVQYVLMPRQW